MCWSRCNNICKCEPSGTEPPELRASAPVPSLSPRGLPVTFRIIIGGHLYGVGKGPSRKAFRFARGDESYETVMAIWIRSN